MTAQHPPPGDTASGAAREWLERERRRAEPTTTFYSAASGATDAPGATAAKKTAKHSTPFVFFAAVVLAQKLVLARFVGWEMALLVGVAVLMAYPYARRHYRIYRMQKLGRAE